MAPGESLTVQRLEGSFGVLSLRNVSVASRVIFTTYLSHPIHKVIIASNQDTEEFHKFLQPCMNSAGLLISCMQEL